MRMATIALAFALIYPHPLPAAPRRDRPVQQTSTAAQSATTTLQQSLAVLVGNTALSDITLSGSARRIAGSDDETGSGVLKALASGARRVDLSFSSGQFSEASDFSTRPKGSWCGPDRASRPIAFHNLLSEPVWFFPSLAISKQLSSADYVATYVGEEIRDDQTVEHISVFQKALFPNPPGDGLYEHLTQVDFYVDAKTLLPVILTFNLHPDDNALADIPIEVRLSDYRLVGGLRVPYHIEKLLNGTLILDFQVESVAVNSGLSASAFSL
jgi:hypothetical protein